MNFLFYLGLGFLALGVFFAAREHLALRACEITEGNVVELVRSQARKGGGAVAPRVRFLARNGTEIFFRSKWFVSHPGVAVGERVRVAYSPANPYDARLLRFGWRYGFAFVAGAFGLFFLLLSVGFRCGNDLLPRLYPLSH